jgi:hypothetical protein
MSQISRRAFGKQTLKWGGALGLIAAMTLPDTAQAAQAFKNKINEIEFLKRDDVSDALKSLYMTYDCTSPYPHKFSETTVKAQMGCLEFCIKQGVEKEYVDHYIATMEPLLKRIGKGVEKAGPDKGLTGMFEGTTCSYQVFERIDIKEGERSFPCPYKIMLQRCKQYLPGKFTIAWEDICNKWCTPVWKGFAGKIGISVSVHPGEQCSVKIV